VTLRIWAPRPWETRLGLGVSLNHCRWAVKRRRPSSPEWETRQCSNPIQVYLGGYGLCKFHVRQARGIPPKS
jgi:hypothetical protein